MTRSAFGREEWGKSTLEIDIESSLQGGPRGLGEGFMKHALFVGFDPWHQWSLDHRPGGPNLAAPDDVVNSLITEPEDLSSEIL